MSLCQIHNVRFYNPEPQAIRCMRLQETKHKLAISRSDASIEIWNLNSTCFIERTICSTTENCSIEGLAWCDDRLFSVGLHGFLIEYNLYQLSVARRLSVTGEAAFCLDVNRTNNLIAVGTEQGYLNIFKIDHDSVSFDKFFDKQEGRIICLKFDDTGEFVVSGSIDAIRIWNVQSGHAIHRLTTGRGETNTPTIVWCLDITNDFTIITGDSRGKLSFWDGKVGAQIESYQSHKADILAICLSNDQKSLYCAGVDPNIISYEKVSVKDGNKKWVKSIQRKIHEHDVNALVTCDNKLYSGGADSYLACSYHPPKTLLKFPPILQNPCVSLSCDARYILLRYPKHLEVWSLGRGQSIKESFVGMLSLQETPKKLLVLQRATKDYDGDDEREGIICSTISRDGKWIMYSTSLGVRLFHIVQGNGKFNLLKVDDLENCHVPCVQAVFTGDNTYLITAPIDGGLIIYRLQEDRASLEQKLETKELKDTVTFLLVSSYDKYLIVGDASSNIIIWTFKKEWVYYCKLPKYQFPPTAIAIHPNNFNMVIAYSDCKIVEYDIKKRHLTQFSRTLDDKEWKSRSYAIRNITFDPRVDSIIILHDDSNILVVNKEKNTVEKKSKMAKIDSKSNLQNGHIKPVNKCDVHSVKKYKHLVHLEWLDDNEMVAVEVNPLTLMEQLPPAFIQKTFGTKKLQNLLEDKARREWYQKWGFLLEFDRICIDLAANKGYTKEQYKKMVRKIKPKGNLEKDIWHVEPSPEGPTSSSGFVGWRSSPKYSLEKLGPLYISPRHTLPYELPYRSIFLG